eukprot:GHVN01005949.1.p1 GENE.GHVN01005949.1~~GHVN01005949.1.p1  ORF type:complete len:371 (-),score=103.57 GHVN01005949.1:66-1058(-)
MLEQDDKVKLSQLTSPHSRHSPHSHNSPESPDSPNSPLIRVMGPHFTLAAYHRHIRYSDRRINLNDFRNASSTVKALVTTPLLSRGIDFPLVGLVVITSPPSDWVDYVHLSGRTGRAGRIGRSLLLLPSTPSEGEVELNKLTSQFKINFTMEQPPSYEDLRGALGDSVPLLERSIMTGKRDMTCLQLENKKRRWADALDVLYWLNRVVSWLGDKSPPHIDTKEEEKLLADLFPTVSKDSGGMKWGTVKVGFDYGVWGDDIEEVSRRVAFIDGPSGPVRWLVKAFKEAREDVEKSIEAQEITSLLDIKGCITLNSDSLSGEYGNRKRLKRH